MKALDPNKIVVALSELSDATSDDETRRGIAALCFQIGYGSFDDRPEASRDLMLLDAWKSLRTAIVIGEAEAATALLNMLCELDPETAGPLRDDMLLRVEQIKLERERGEV